MTRLHLARIEGEEDVQLAGGTFLLRITTDEGGAVHRCCLRHVASGREAYVQGGPELRAFVIDCLLLGRDAAEWPRAGGDE